ncbi:hypothetical protein [Paenibacillus naphthalenovorans]|uniref:Uncharacterized protein n=1 Tax=Paenibacillus naphthalenovorans TaxID=162209 RepID=A0A0U2UGI2_9BACL|nr:hypothetical protein [Paenibacillus naphthalenovorans]ALS22284.1 hypothetical protein IJ22_19100 [Paenibacillus naphthalenovorans]
MDEKTLIAILSFILTLTKFILDEYRRWKDKRKEAELKRLEQLEQQKENGAYPPRKDRHHKR